MKHEWVTILALEGQKSEFNYKEIEQKQIMNNRKRKIIWFTTPFNFIVKTKIDKDFFHFLDQYFPKESAHYRIFTEFSMNMILSRATAACLILADR